MSEERNVKVRSKNKDERRPGQLPIRKLYMFSKLNIPDLQSRTNGEGWSTSNNFKQPTPSNFIAGRPKAALLFWFFSDFRCGVPLVFDILVIYKYKNR